MIAADSPFSSSNHVAILTSSRRYSGGSVLRFRSSITFCGGVQWLMSVSSGPRRQIGWASRMDAGCFREKNRRGFKIEEENGGEDVLNSAAFKAGVSPGHLVIMVNGLVGSSADWRYAAEQFVKRFPDNMIVHCSECNYSKLTFDGVDLMGERLAEEVLAVVRGRPQVQKISFVAHSLGGLIARYAVARLYEHLSTNLPSPSGTSLSKEHTDLTQGRDRIAGLEPMNFITFATPHLGSMGHKQLPFLCGLPFLERRASQTAHLLVGRTGKHLFLTDNDDGRPPLLLQMVNDSGDLSFISALRVFKRRVAYANANYDHMVGWRTSSIRRQHELPKSNLLMKDQKYPHVVRVEQETVEKNHSKASSVVVDQILDLEGFSKFFPSCSAVFLPFLFFLFLNFLLVILIL
uniref:DUF676 domain-containing protein n=1 Tax=Rhizophora mucronata TaxID=61149 RepID=A0A2P2LJ72_RHIMU